MNSLCTGFEPCHPLNRRKFLAQAGGGLGAIAMAGMQQTAAAREQGVLVNPHFAARARRVIYLFQSGGPSQLDLYDHRPLLNELHGTQLPDEVRRGQRLTTMSGSQSSLPLVGSPFKFQRYGEGGIELSELLPHTAKVADQLCVIRSMYTEAINHGPAVTFLQTGSQFPGRPSIGTWLNYGLGDANEDLPAYIVLITKDKGGQPLLSRFWGSGFLASRFQGVRFRPSDDPVLYLNNPPGVDARSRRMLLDRLRELHTVELERSHDAEIESRIRQYELAFRMQTSIPDVTNMAGEPQHVLRMYGDDVRKPGSFAANCLLARRLAERGVRFIQLFHPGWDHHGGLPGGIATQCRETDQPAAALVRDLEQRGLLEDTLVVWGGEFGRTNYCQGKLTPQSFGRDHHPRCFSIWMAGGGVRPGTTYGETDPFGYNVAENGVHVHDFQATLMHLLGHRSRAFDLQASGTTLPAHRCPR